MFVIIYVVFILLFETVICENFNSGSRPQYRIIQPEYRSYTPGGAWTSSSSSSVISSGKAVGTGSQSYAYSSPGTGNSGANSFAYGSSTGSGSVGPKAIVFVVPPPRPVKNDCHQSNTGGGDWRCNGDRNATFRSCPNPCPRSCRNPQGPKQCYAMCVPHGCECKPGYVLSDEGRCILYKDCPGFLCNGDRNATFKACPDPCPSTCDLLGKTRVCARKCKPYGCECNPGYHLNKEGKCVYVEDCPGALCKGDKNATYLECPNPCPKTCDNPEGPDVCTAVCASHGCQCNEGYYLNDYGRCVLLDDCPGCRGDRNATYKECPSTCPKTCNDPNGPDACIDVCDSPGCECNEGYYLNGDGKCVLLEDCQKTLGCKGDRNATYKQCPSACRKTCDNPNGPEGCIAVCAMPGCECNNGYYLNSDGKCVLLGDCPGCKGDRNATYTECPSPCPKTCDNPNGPDACIAVCASPGCACNEGYLLNSDGKCVLLEDCPGCKGDLNATYTEFPSPCPKTCDNPNGPDACIAVCASPGCACKEGYLLNSDGKCVLLEDCPGCKGDRNATYKECPSACPKTCDNPKGPDVCIAVCTSPGCECKENYFLNTDGKCVLLEDCPGCNGDRNATYKECPSPCPKTCDNPKGPDVCIAVCASPGCECKEGYFLNTDGKCVLLEDCPGCNGDRNATYKECPSPCPKTCDNPKGPDVCIAVCASPGCECKEGYFLNTDGKCVLLEDCPGCNGDRNATYKECPSPCPKTCDNPKGPDVCAAVCASPGCECKEGYFLNTDGKCVLLEDCPGCKGDRNATYKECPSPCPKTCDNPKGPDACIAVCASPGCECKEGYFLNSDGKCVLLEDCSGCKGDRNATYKECPSPCPKTCENPKGPDACAAVCASPGCECKEGYFLNTDGKCVLLEDCPGCKGDRNATYKECPSPCPKTCDNPKGPDVCAAVCASPGCECKEGYFLNSDGKCVLLEDCPGCKGDRNATYKECPSPCPRTCKLPGGPEVCTTQCPPNGCECKEGYYLNDDGKCVQLQDCSGAKECSTNETFVFCKAGCPTDYCPEDDSRAFFACDPPFPCYSGCVCKGDYLRLSYEDDRCVLATECPPVNCTRPGEQFSSCPPACLKERCSDFGPEYNCDSRFFYCRPRCVCKPGFYRNDSDICVPEKECPPLQCGFNEIPVECKTVCPPQFCNISYTDYFCTNDTKCERGCDCLPNHLRNDSGVCIFNEDCPPPPTLPTCGENEVASACSIKCPPQTCESIFTTYLCDNQTCEVGCDCIDEYLRNDDGFCIPSEECFLGPACEIPPECRATCYNPTPDASKCPAVAVPTENQNGCKCKEGYILSSTEGECIRISECPVDEGCNGDPNSVATECPWSCPSTCASPDASSCGKPCARVGCQCRPGLILSELNGKCILPEECPNGDPCGVNGTFADCSFRCPNQVCPEDDSRAVFACKPGRPCPSGCMCKEFYRRASNEDDTCILAKDCAEITCTRPYEKYNPCTNSCLAEDCTDLLLDTNCEADPKECIPKCVCSEGYYRDQVGDCVPKSYCPNQCDVNQKCRPTCAIPNPPNCKYIPPSECNNECNCQSGYILDKPGGKCIKIEDCPQNQGCNNDPHAQVKACPQPCPSTCESPDAFPCKKKCLDVGCECQSGYLLSNDGLCVLPEQCPGGNPCGINGTFVPCRYDCLTNFCPMSDSRDAIICENTNCLSGCVCKLNYRRLSFEDTRCIVSTDCPPINCTRDFEEFNACPSPCLSGYCEDVDKGPITCNTLVLNCNPQCTCIKDYYRNPFTDKCVSAAKCREINKNKKGN